MIVLVSFHANHDDHGIYLCTEVDSHVQGSLGEVAQQRNLLDARIR